MKKSIVVILFILFFCEFSFADSYYFKKCKLNENVYADYIINVDTKEIRTTIKRSDGDQQEIIDKIKTIENDQIITDIIQNAKNKKYYLQYYLDKKSQSVVRQRYIQKEENGLILPDGPKKESYCEDVKADWDKKKIDLDALSKEEKEILKTQDEMLKKQEEQKNCKGGRDNWTNYCKGSHRSETGNKYSGLYKDGKIVQGEAIYSDGSKYVGEFKDSKPNGQGNFVFADGSKYFGGFKDGRYHGNGTRIWSDGKKYSGKFKNDLFHGKGTFESPDGEKYVGDWENGKRHGEGKLTYNDGKTYIGQFIAGYEHGKGTCFDKEGESIVCKKDISEKNKNIHDIQFSEKKWIKLSEYEYYTGKGKKIMDSLKSNFDKQARKICEETGNFKILEKKIIVLEIDDTPAFGIETVIKLGIDGAVECIK